jgi:taurine dioxygenase
MTLGMTQVPDDRQAAMRECALRGAAELRLTGHIGSEIRGFELIDLQPEDVGALSQLLADRGVLVFRNQVMTVGEQVEIGRRLGELHIHPTIQNELDHPEVLVIHTDGDSDRTAGESWHTDVSCDRQPPAISMLRIERTPSVGGDTVFASMYRAYETLSDPIKELLLGLTAVHSGAVLRRRRPEAREVPINEHPMVRTHPISRRRALFVNSAFTERIVGLSDIESDALLRMLYDHIARGNSFQVRVRWEPNTVVLWDNRCVQHHATWDYFPETRHGYRVTTVGEEPFLDRSA